MAESKQIEFCGDSLAVLRGFSEVARRRAGYQLDRVQRGLEPDDWKPMHTVGAGAREVRIREPRGIYRVVYVAEFNERMFVLHCFQKKSQKTSSRDLEICRRRYKELAKEFIL